MEALTSYDPMRGVVAAKRARKRERGLAAAGHQLLGRVYTLVLGGITAEARTHVSYLRLAAAARVAGFPLFRFRSDPPAPGASVLGGGSTIRFVCRPLPAGLRSKIPFVFFLVCVAFFQEFVLPLEETSL